MSQDLEGKLIKQYPEVYKDMEPLVETLPKDSNDGIWVIARWHYPRARFQGQFLYIMVRVERSPGSYDDIGDQPPSAGYVELCRIWIRSPGISDGDLDCDQAMWLCETLPKACSALAAYENPDANEVTKSWIDE